MAQDTLDAEVDRLSTAVTAAERRQATLAARAEAAEEQRAKLMTRLRDEFGCETVEEAEALLARLEADLGTEIERVRTELEAAGG